MKSEEKPKELKKNINDLKFYVSRCKDIWSDKDKPEIESFNLFDVPRVKLSVAHYVVRKERGEDVENPLFACFNDVWSRVQFEYIIVPFPFREDYDIDKVGKKVDIYTMYVEPNKDLLMDMVNSVSLNSARKVIAEERKRWKKA